MSYIGISPQLKAYKDAMFVAIGGETVIPIKCNMETLVIKNGSFLIPRFDYYINRENTISASTAASPGDEYYIVDISTFSFSESITRTEVEDMLDQNARPLFEVLWWPSRNSIPSGLVPADGQELSRGLYMDAFTGIEAGLVPLVADADWLSTPSKRASYTTGDGSTTFRVPDYNGRTDDSLGALVLRGDGKNAAPAGTIQGDAIRDIQGKFGGISNSNNRSWPVGIGYTESAFVKMDNNGYDIGPQASVQIRPPAPSPTLSVNVHFAASHVVPTAPENRMVNTAGVWCVRLFNGTVYAGRANAAQLATEVGKLQSEVQKLESKLAKDKWYSATSSQFTSRIETTNGWTIANAHEGFIKETDNEIRIKAIFRRSDTATADAIFNIKNPKNDHIASPYCTYMCNVPTGSNGFSSYYTENVSSTSEVVPIVTNHFAAITGWIMADFTFTKNPSWD